MSNGRLKSDEKPARLSTLSVEVQSELELEHEPVSGTYLYDSDPEDNNLPDIGEYKSNPSIDVLSLAMKQDDDAIKQLTRLLEDLKEGKQDIATIKEKFSLQCQSEEHRGTNAAWWLARSFNNERSNLRLFYKFYQIGVLTKEQLAATCQGSKFTGTNPLFWITCKYSKQIYLPILPRLIKDKFITQSQLQAQYTGIDDCPEANRYCGYTVADMMVAKVVESHLANNFLYLLEYERFQQQKPLTANLFTDNIYEIVKHLNAETAQDTALKECILAVHMILVAGGHSLIRNNSESFAASIIHEFDNHVIDLLTAMLPPPIRDVVTLPSVVSDSIGLREMEGGILKELLLNKILLMRNAPGHWFFKGKPTFLPEFTTYISKLGFFKSYIKNHLVPLAEKRLLDKSMDSFIDSTEKLVKEIVPRSSSEDKSEDVMVNFKNVMRTGMESYFMAHLGTIITRETQKNITAKIMTYFTKEVITGDKKFSSEVVQKILAESLTVFDPSPAQEMIGFGLKTHSGKIRFWGIPDPEDVLSRNEVRPNIYRK